MVFELQQEKDCISDLVELLKPIESKAKAKGNSLDDIDLKWLEQHLSKKKSDTSFLENAKNHLRSELSLIEVHALLNKCKEIVSYIKRSGAQNKLNISLKQENETRWNSKLIMLLSFPINFTKVKCHFYTYNSVHLKYFPNIRLMIPF